MTARDYLERLSSALAPMEAEGREDFLREMESHILGLLERKPGEGEEAIVAGLTPPERVAAELLGDSGTAAAGAAGSAEAERGAGQAEENPRARKHARGSARGPAERLKEILGLFAAPGATEESLGEIPASGISSVSVSLLSGDFSAEPRRGGAIGITARGVDPSGRLEVETADGVLSLLEREDGGPPLERLELRLPPSIEYLELRTASGDMVVSRLDCAITAKTASGDFSATSCPGTLAVESSSGDLEFEDCAMVQATTASGDVRLEESSGDAMIRTASGDVRVEGIARSLGVETASGDISVEGASGRVAATSSSGEIAVRGCRRELALASISGGVELDASEGFGGAVVTTVSGEVEVELPDQPDAVLRLSSASGEIHAEEGGRGRGTRVGEIRLGTGGPVLEVKTQSGDITVEW